MFRWVYSCLNTHMPDNNNVSPAAVQKYLKGVEYPTSKNALIDAAKENDAPDDILKKIQQLPSNEFGGPQDVMKALGEIV